MRKDSATGNRMTHRSPPHIEAFEVWYSDIRNRCESGSEMEALMKELKALNICSVTDRTLRTWKTKYKWPDRALRRDADIQSETDKRSVESITEMNLRHGKSAILAHDKCVEFILRKTKKPFNNLKGAIDGLDKSIAIERTARGEASLIAEQREVETVQDIQVMLDKMSEEKRGEVAKELDERKKIEVVTEVKDEVDRREKDRDRTGDEDKVNAE